MLANLYTKAAAGCGRINIHIPGSEIRLKNGMAAGQTREIHPVNSQAEKLFPFSVTP